MRITYLGHAVVQIEGVSINALIDPFISDNPLCPLQLEDLHNITHIFVTHGHGDHLGNTVEIASRCNSVVVANFEIANYLSNNGFSIHAMHIGGRTQMSFGKVKMTPALHGSGIIEPNGSIVSGGNPCGFVIEVEGQKIYHAGDTGLTMDMKLLEVENIDVAFLPIGGNYTMDIEDAVRAVDFIKPQIVVPMHYDTFPAIKAYPAEFASTVYTKDTHTRIMNPGDVIDL